MKQWFIILHIKLHYNNNWTIDNNTITYNYSWTNDNITSFTNLTSGPEIKVHNAVTAEPLIIYSISYHISNTAKLMTTLLN